MRGRADEERRRQRRRGERRGRQWRVERGRGKEVNKLGKGEKCWRKRLSGAVQWRADKEEECRGKGDERSGQRRAEEGRG